MPKEIKITDRNMLNGKRVPWASGIDVVKEKTIKRGGAVKKKITTTDMNDVVFGQPRVERTIKVEKYDKSGKLKQSKTLSSINGKLSKTVTKPGGKTVSRSVGLIGKMRLKK